MNEEWNRDNSLNNLPEGTEHPGEENQRKILSAVRSHRLILL